MPGEPPLVALFSSGMVLGRYSAMICIPLALGTGGILVIHIRRRPTGYIPAASLGNRAFVIASGFTLLTSLLYFTLLFATPALAGNRGDRTSLCWRPLIRRCWFW